MNNSEVEGGIDWDGLIEHAEANLPPLTLKDIEGILTAPSAEDQPAKPLISIMASGTVAELTEQMMPIFIKQHQDRIASELGNSHILILQFNKPSWETIDLNDLSQWDAFLSKLVKLNDHDSTNIINAIFKDTDKLKYLIYIGFKYPETLKQLEPDDKYEKIISASLSTPD